MNTSLIIGLILGAILGGGFAFAFFRSQLVRERTLREAGESASTRNLEQQRLMLEQRVKDHELSEQKLKEQFSLLAQEVLSKNLEAHVKALKTENDHSLDKKKQEFNQTFEEIKNTLKTTGEKIQNFERERTDQYAKIEKQIQTISQQEQKLIFETERLKSALTTSQSVRGRWGELVLRNILEQSDLVQGIDFEEQSMATGENGNILRPDFVIKLPQSGHLVIDSKASIFESYLESEATPDEAAKQQLHKDFSLRLRDRVKDLSSKEYQNHVSKSLPYVILFVPSEAAIRAAFDVDQDLFKWAVDKKVFIASPATILPLIMLIGRSWREHRMSEKAQELATVVNELGKRLGTFMTRLSGVQKGLDQANRAWNEAVDQSWNGRQGVQKSLEKARELGGNLPEADPMGTVDSNPRALENLAEPKAESKSEPRSKTKLKSDKTELLLENDSDQASFLD